MRSFRLRACLSRWSRLSASARIGQFYWADKISAPPSRQALTRGMLNRATEDWNCGLVHFQGSAWEWGIGLLPFLPLEETAGERRPKECPNVGLSDLDDRPPRGKAAIRRRCPNGAFTLLEVVLAVVIATGMLAVVFYFYHQAAELRTQVLGESTRVTAARLILERLTSELRTALPGTDLHSGLWGSSNQLEFVRLVAPVTSSPGANTNEVALPLSPTLKKIQYRLNSSPDETDNAVLLRLEEPLISAQERAITNETTSVAELEPTPKGLLLTREFQFVCFRYWNGTAWQDSWSADALPLGIEVKLGVESLPPETMPEDYPFDQFRRIISLPLAVPTPPSRDETAPEASLIAPGEIPAGASPGGKAALHRENSRSLGRVMDRAPSSIGSMDRPLPGAAPVHRREESA